jgi:hypothetical protein
LIARELTTNCVLGDHAYPLANGLQNCVKTWLKEPLLHFLLLGAIIFIAYGQMQRGDSSDDEIVISVAQQENLALAFARTWQRPPSDAELNSLINDFIRQEIAYREGQAMQLDRDDIVIRRRLRQKVELLAEDVVAMRPPQDSELRQYFDEHADAFRRPAALSFRQVYFNTDPDLSDATRRAGDLLARLQRGEDGLDLPNAGDPSMLPRELENVRVPELSSIFGTEFTDAIQRIGLNSWAGPIRSGFGVHLVKVENKVDSRMPAFDEVSELVTREWQVERRNRAIDGLYDRLTEKYSITIEAPTGILPDSIRESTP